MLEEHEVARLGSVERFPVNLRIIAASTNDMLEALRQGQFRADLYYKLDVFELHLPPLRERAEDIPLLISHFLLFERQRLGSRVEQVAAPALKLLKRYDWPGNIRELKNFCERLSVLCSRPMAQAEDAIRVLPVLAQLPMEPIPSVTAQSGSEALDERTQLLRLLDRFDGSRRKTAEYLQIDPSTLWRRMKKLGLL